MNWLALQKVCELLPLLMRGQISKVLQEINPNPPHPRKKRKIGHEPAPEKHFKRGEASSPSTPTKVAPISAPPTTGLPTGTKNGESIDSLRRMILGELEGRYTDHQKQYVSEHRISQNIDRLNLTKAREIRCP